MDFPPSTPPAGARRLLRRLTLLCTLLAWFMPATAPAQTLSAQSFGLNTYKRVLDGQWQGIRVASDGNVYFAASTHSAHHGAAFFKYNPASKAVTLLAEDITTLCGENPEVNPQGKIHSDIVEANGWLYFSTHFSSEYPGALDQWTGSHVIGYQLSTGQFRDYGVIHPNYTSYSAIGVDPSRNHLFVFVTGMKSGQSSYLYRIDTVSGAKTNLGQVGGSFNSAFWTFVDARGDVWFSIAYQNGAVNRVRAGSGIIDTFPNVLPPLLRWDADQANPSSTEQQKRWIMWMQPLDGNRAVLTLGWYGGGLYIFDSTKPLAEAFQKIQHIGYTDLGLAVNAGRVYYLQRANRAFGHQEATDFHLLSVALNQSGYPITDHGLIRDQDGRLVWRIPSMAADPSGRIFLNGDWWTLPGEEGSLRWTYTNGVESYEPLPRGAFFALAGDTPTTPSGGSTLRINSGGSTYDYTDPSGNVWVRDQYFSGGGTAYATSVSGTDSMWIYQTGRQGVWTDFSYSIPVDAGSYRVTLKFAELYKTAVGQRVFHVDINGSRVLANFDILSHAAPKTAYDAGFSVSAPAGKIDIAFIGVTGRAIVSAIEVTPEGTAPPPVTVTVSPTTASLSAGETKQFTATVENGSSAGVTWSISPSTGSISASGLYQAPALIQTEQTVTVRATSVADPTKSAAATVTLTPTTQPADTTPPVRSDPSPTGTLPIGTTQTTMSLKTNEPATCRYGTDRSSFDQMTQSFTTSDGLSHSTVISNLVDGGHYLFNAKCRDAAGNTNPDEWGIQFEVDRAPDTQLSLVRINCGGSTYDYTDPSGRVWVRDQYYNLGGTAFASSVSGTDSMWLYQTARRGVWTDFSYSIPVVGTMSYSVTLKFAELYKTAPGQRVFHVDINGHRVLTNFDILQHVAPKTAYDVPMLFTSANNQGKIDIVFTGVVDRAIVSAIEVRPEPILPTTVTVSPKTVTLGPGQSQQFTAYIEGEVGYGVQWMQPWTGTITTNGLYTAPAQIEGTQSVMIMAVSNAEPSIYDTATVTLVPGTTVDTTPPIRSAASPSGTLPAGTRQATLSLQTNEASTCRYGAAAGVAFASLPFAFTSTNGTAHSAPVENLADGQSYTYYARCRDQAGNTNPDDFPIAFQVAAAAPPGGSIVRINSGGSTYDYTDPSGFVWLKDQFFSQGGTAYASAVAGTNTMWLYQTARRGVWTDFSYSIPVTGGSYRVTLKFAELYKTAVGERVFHVDINGSRVLSNFDILTHVAPKTAYDASFIVQAPSGKIDIAFIGSVDRGIVSAIEILPAVQ